MFMCFVNLKSVNKLDLTWKQSFLILPLLGIIWMLWLVNNQLIGTKYVKIYFKKRVVNI
jgi:hypothetical protein